MKYFWLTLKLIFILYLSYLIYFLVSSHGPTSPMYRPPVLIWIMDIINLYVHEAGHFFFQIFGRWMHFIGGSLFQCLVPLALIIVTWRHNPSQAYYSGFWLGESMINVSIYIRDAPYRRLPLIGKGLIHDWNWLLAGNLESAEPIADTVFIVGILFCVGAVIVGIYFAFHDFRWYQEKSLPE